MTLPDIQLLPELSILLGTSIDALFSMTDDKRMERIENMLWDQRFLSREEFEAEERFLKDKCLEPDAQARATLLLAELYCKRAREYRELVSPLARKALELLPDYEKAAHTALFEAEGGVFPDWNAVNHHRTIAFYQDFITRWHDAYITEIEEFCDCVATGRKATPGVIDGTQSTKIAFRCKESFLTDKKLTLE